MANLLHPAVHDSCSAYPGPPGSGNCCIVELFVIPTMYIYLQTQPKAGGVGNHVQFQEQTGQITAIASDTSQRGIIAYAVCPLTCNSCMPVGHLHIAAENIQLLPPETYGTPRLGDWVQGRSRSLACRSDESLPDAYVVDRRRL